MKLTLLSGRSNRPLGEAVAGALGESLGTCTVESFPDGEAHVEVNDDLRGCDVYLVQPTGPPVADNILELMLLADAARRAGASRVTGVVPYFGYARQNRRTSPGETIGARVVANIMNTGLDRIITVDLHESSLEGFFSIPVEHLSAVELLTKSLKERLPENPVLVAPDLGATKLAHAYADILDIPVAYIYKVRTSGDEVSVRNVVGDIEKCSPILIDDMISTAGTMVKAIEALLSRGCLEKITICASHGLFVGEGPERLSDFPISAILVSDSLEQTGEIDGLPVETVSLRQIISDTIKRVHE